MSLGFPRTPLEVVAGEIQAAVGREAFNWAVREAERQGLRANAALRRAINHFRFGSRGAVNYRNRKRDFSGGIKPLKLTFEEPPAMSYSEDINFKRSKISLGSSRKRTGNDVFKSIIGNMDEVIYRWQSCSLNLLGPGKVPIGFGKDSLYNNTAFVAPMHMMSLTHHPNFKADNSVGARFGGLFRYIYKGPSSSFAGNFGYQYLYSTNNDGVVDTNGSWHIEKGTHTTNIDSVFHKFTDIRLNLYGSASYPLKYRIMLVTSLPEEMQPLVQDPTDGLGTVASYPIASEEPLNEFILDHVRPLVTNPIIGSNSDSSWKGKFKVVKDVTYSIPCLSYGNAQSEATNVINSTNVRSVNMFVRHDRFRDYGWKSLNTDKDLNTSIASTGWTETDTSVAATSSLLVDVDYEQRLFFVISCTCPNVIDSADQYNTSTGVGGQLNDSAVSYATQGSYDIVVRNCFRQVSGL